MKFTTPEFAMNYTLKGNQYAERTLVFLNGIFHGEPSWIKQSRYPFIKNEHKLVFIDYPGCGDSEIYQPFTYDQLCQAIHTLIKELQLPNVTLIGYSFGGILGLELTKRYPSDIDHLIMVNSGADISTKGKKMMGSVRHMMETDVDLSTIFLSVYPWFFSDDYLRQLNDFQAIVLQRYVEYNHSRPSVLAFLDALSQKTSSAPEKLTAPALLIGTQGDIICSLDQQKLLIDSHPSFEWDCLPINTHAANIEAHLVVNKRIQQFLEAHYEA